MTIMVVSPHPDDETLGAGGTLLRYKKEGNSIFWLNVTDVKKNDVYGEDFVNHRKEQIRRVKEYYCFDGFYNLSLPPTKLSSLEEGVIISEIRRVFDDVKPTWLIIPGEYDAHSDHKAVYNACMANAKTFRSPYIKRITTMEIPSETDYGFQKSTFIPNLYVDITESMEGKIEAMQIYDTEIEESPFPRSLDNIQALAVVRGGASCVKYAEAFHIVKMME